MRGWVCNLQCSNSDLSHAGAITIFYCLIRNSSNLEHQVPVLISQRNRAAQLYPLGTGCPFCFLLWLAGLWWRYCNLRPHGVGCSLVDTDLYSLVESMEMCSVTAHIHRNVFVLLLSSNRYICHIASSLSLCIPNSLEPYRHFFFSEGGACDICDWSWLPSSWLGSYGNYSSPAAVPSLRPLILSSSLIRSKLVRVYCHHLLFRGRCF
jgi:hypothetical protein